MIEKFVRLFVVLAFWQGVFSQESPHVNMEMACETCHLTASWSKVRFFHDDTNFPLLDRHKEVDCKSCHDLKDFSKVSQDCITCHDDIHQAKLGSDCDRCHTEQGWEIFDTEEVHAGTQFPLIGAHTLIDCQSCHKNTMQGDFALFATECVDCHQQEYLEVQNPNHVSNAFSTDCRECHEMNTWAPAFLPNHDIFFPIFAGSHNGAWNDCKDCHFNPATFQDFSCTDCHEHRQPSMDRTHQGIDGYSYDSNACYSCHPTGEGGEFKDHDNRFFPIFSGVHSGEWDACETCHTIENDRSFFTCFECHEHNQPDTDTQHTGIPSYTYDSQQCYACHPTGEEGEFREHDNLYFPIFSGEHRGEWDDCETCHNEPNNRAVFNCFDCHEHRQSAMDSEHQGMAGYAYDSAQCFFCHPDGKGGEFRDHDAEFFPIFAGSHAGEWDECATCHTDASNRQIFSCVVCHEHEQPAMDTDHNGIPDYTFDSAQCLFCHPDGESGEFMEHDNLFFPIFSGEHRGEWDSCNICHNVPEDRKIFTCLDCHDHSQSRMDDKHLGEVNDYAYDSNACYECHPNGKEDDDD